MCVVMCSRSPGNYMGDVNISAILDSFSVSYDKRVRPNYGGEYRFVCTWVVLFSRAVARPFRGGTTLLRGDVVAIIHTHFVRVGPDRWFGVGCLATRSISPDRHSARSR